MAVYFLPFVRKCVGFFSESKRSKNIATRVKRGRAHSCSSKCEDLVAEYIAKMIPDKYEFLVDYPMTFRINEGERGRTYYPDISVIVPEENRLAGVVEVKIDLGYLSEKWGDEYKKKIDYMNQSKCVSYNEGIGSIVNRKPCSLQISGNLNSHIIIISGLNDHGKAKDFKENNQNVFILMPKHHPNDYRMNFTNDDEINEYITQTSENSCGRQNWQKLISSLNAAYNRSQKTYMP